jgi:hypothetical protein
MTAANYCSHVDAGIRLKIEAEGGQEEAYGETNVEGTNHQRGREQPRSTGT